MMQVTEDTLAEAMETSFRAVDSGLRPTLFRFTEAALTKMVNHGLIYIRIHDNFKRQTQ